MPANDADHAPTTTQPDAQPPINHDEFMEALDTIGRAIGYALALVCKGGKPPSPAKLAEAIEAAIYDRGNVTENTTLILHGVLDGIQIATDGSDHTPL